MVLASVRPMTRWSLCAAVFAASCGSSDQIKIDVIDPDGDGRVYGLELIAGDTGGPGDLDGAADVARFSAPSALAIDAAGTLYVADAGNSVIRKVTAAGTVSTLAGTPGVFGGADGTGAGARFQTPSSVAVGADGTVYVADTGNSTIRAITPAGEVDTLAGRPGAHGSADGTGGDARFSGPIGVAVDGAGNVFVSDTSNATIRKIAAGGVVTTLAGRPGMAGNTDGTGAAARFARPGGMAIDGDGNLYVSDNDTLIRKVTPGGVVTTLAGRRIPGSADGAAQFAQFNQPKGVAVDASGTVYVADSGNNTIRQIARDGTVTTLAGAALVTGSADGAASTARFNHAAGIAVDPSGALFVADTFNHTVRQVAARTREVTTLAGEAPAFGYADGHAGAARFARPLGIAFDGASNLFVADAGNLTIRKIAPTGTVSTVAGIHGQSGSQDGAVAEALFSGPVGVSVDGAGNVFVAEFVAHTIREVTPDGMVSTIAGVTNMPGAADGTGAAARLNGPGITAIDAAGALFVADTANNAIRKIAPGGVVTTLPSVAVDQDDDDGRFNVPSGVAVDAAGNVYVADTFNHAIRKISADGVVTTLAGSPGEIGHADGDGGAARFSQPFGVTVDGAGNVYVADFGNSAIRKITPAGHVTTLAGVPSQVGIVLGATPGFAAPIALTMVGDSLAVVDGGAILLLRHAAAR